MAGSLLQLAHNFENQVCVAGWYLSEKLDGMRAYWDGGLTTGMPKSVVPWANTAKDDRYREEEICTGLWSRYGNVIHCPNSWSTRLPSRPLDGELYGSSYRQDMMSIVKQKNPSPQDWKSVTYHVFDSPAYETVFADRAITGPNYNIKLKGVLDWLAQLKNWDVMEKPTPALLFQSTYRVLQRKLQNETAIPHPQMGLPMGTEDALMIIDQQAERIVAAGGEGLIVRNPYMPYTASRTHGMCKIKPCPDAEGTVIGYTSGHGKLQGLMGAAIIEANYQCKEGDGIKKIVFKLSGFNETERRFQNQEDYAWAMNNPGQVCPSAMDCPSLPRGSQVTFTYRGFTADGIPQEARYKRRLVL